MKRTLAPTFLMVMGIAMSGCALKDPEGHVTNAEFEAPITVKRDGMVEATALYHIGSNGNRLDFRWSLDRTPAGSAASLLEDGKASTTFQADVLGEYMLTLVVDDGRDQSAPFTQMVLARNVAPEASVVALPADRAQIGQMVQLDASGSTDCDGDQISYRWYFDHLPSGSNAELSDPTAANPTFVPDVPGLYAPRVAASDGMDEGEAHGVFIWAGDNARPFAVAGDDRTASVGETIRLDGSASGDPDSADEILQYTWTLLQKPAASGIDLSGGTQAIAEITPDVVGDYIVELVVTDEAGAASAPDQLRITAR